MSYNKRTWATGNVVGAVDLNRIENGIADIDVDEIRGWGVQNTQLFSETVTTTVGEMGLPEAVFSYATLINSSSIIVTLNGTEYTCPRQEAEGAYFYGGIDAAEGTPDFSNFPFFIVSGDANTLYTETTGVFVVIVSIEAINASDDFQLAVQTAMPGVFPFQVTLGTTTWQEVYEAVASGQQAYVIRNSTRIQYVILVSADYSIVCLTNSLNGITTVTYSTDTGTADGVLQA